MTSRHRYTIAAASTAAFMLLTGCAGSTAGSGGTTGAPSVSPASDTSTSPPAEASHTPTATPVAATTPASATETSACTLVTEKEITATLGADLGRGTAFTGHGSSQCQYGSYATQFVLVNLTPSEGGAAYARMRDNPNAVSGGTTTAIMGIGDQAMGISAPHTASIYFVEGAALVVVSVENHAVRAPLSAKTSTLAKTAAGRL